jgi:hypothetical protein
MRALVAVQGNPNLKIRNLTKPSRVCVFHQRSIRVQRQLVAWASAGMPRGCSQEGDCVLETQQGLTTRDFYVDVAGARRKALHEPIKEIAQRSQRSFPTTGPRIHVAMSAAKIASVRDRYGKHSVHAHGSSEWSADAGGSRGR